MSFVFAAVPGTAQTKLQAPGGTVEPGYLVGVAAAPLADTTAAALAALRPNEPLRLARDGAARVSVSTTAGARVGRVADDHAAHWVVPLLEGRAACLAAAAAGRGAQAVQLRVFVRQRYIGQPYEPASEREASAWSRIARMASFSRTVRRVGGTDEPSPDVASSPPPKRQCVSATAQFQASRALAAQHEAEAAAAAASAAAAAAPMDGSASGDDDDDDDGDLDDEGEGEGAYEETAEEAAEAAAKAEEAGDPLVKSMYSSLEGVSRAELEEMEAPEGLRLRLRHYQKQALWWLLNRERTREERLGLLRLPPGWSEHVSGGKKFYWNEQTRERTWTFPNADKLAPQESAAAASFRGGLLCDEMGMGKTIEMISLILANPKRAGGVPQSKSAGLVGAQAEENEARQAEAQARAAQDAQFSKCTLIVCPLSLINQWADEVRNNAPSLTVYTHHGPFRQKDAAVIGQHDIVVTTYQTLASEMGSTGDRKSRRGSSPPGPLFALRWHRVVLDEAHVVKDGTTLAARAACALQARMRWCVTGTPVQNRLDDVFSLLCFLHVRPFGEHAWWKENIGKKVKAGDNSGFAELQGALNSVLLRRTKDMRVGDAPILSLPPRIVTIRSDVLSTRESQFYQSLHSTSRNEFTQFMKSGRLRENYAHILQLLLRLRQACDHPSLVGRSSKRPGGAEVANLVRTAVEDANINPAHGGTFLALRLGAILGDGWDDDECVICLNVTDRPVMTACGHVFCRLCIEKLISGAVHVPDSFLPQQGTCPVCSSAVMSADLINLPSANDSSDDSGPEVARSLPSSQVSGSGWNTSTKIEALLQELAEIDERPDKWPPGTKSIIFSQWTSMLNLIELSLAKAGRRFVRLDGSMTQGQREKSIRAFKADPKIKIFLISMKAGGLGLNLTAACRVFLMDPWWNPAAEVQAIDRVHRLGQKYPVVVTRFVIENSIEERIVLTDLVGDRSLERFRVEYEKLHRALKKSHESEKRLIKRCRELNNEIVTNAAKVQTALRLSQEDQKTIAQLRRELEKAWKMVDLSHQKEAQAKETISKLKIEIANLTRLVEQGAGLSIGQEHSVKELLKIKEELSKERDDLRQQLEALKKEIDSLAEHAEAQEKDKAAAEAQIKALRTQLTAKSVDSEKEQYRRKSLENQLKDLKAALDLKAAEVKQKQQQLAKTTLLSQSLEHQLSEQRLQTEKALKDCEFLNQRTLKLSQDLEEEMDRNTQLLSENSQKQMELKAKEDQIKDMELAEQRLIKAKKKLSDHVLALEQQIEQVEGSKEALKTEITGLTREIEALRRQQESDKKKYEEIQRDKELLNKKMEKAQTEVGKQEVIVMSSELAKQNLQQEIDGYKVENQRQRSEIYSLEKEREKYVAEAQAANNTYLQALEEVKLREMAITDLQKKIVEQEARLKQQKSLYEAVRSERNLYSKNLIEAQDEIAEMQRKFKIMNHQIDQLKEEIFAKGLAAVNEHYQLLKVQKLRDKYKTELDQVTRQIQTSDSAIATQQEEIKRLNQIISDLEGEVSRQRKEHEIVSNERDILMQQLVRRNEELSVLYEKISLQQAALANGEVQYRDKCEDIRVLKTKITDLKRELGVLRGQLQHVDSLKSETYQLQRELLSERAKVRALSEELENPMNIHRWRKLQGSDPAAFEMIQKIQALQKRLIQKTEQLVERDAEVQEGQLRLKELEAEVSRTQAAKESSQQLAALKATLAEKTKEVRVLKSQASTYQAQVAAFKDDIEQKTYELNEYKKRFYDRKRKEQAAREPAKLPTPSGGDAPRVLGGGFRVGRTGFSRLGSGDSFSELGADLPPAPSSVPSTAPQTGTNTRTSSAVPGSAGSLGASAQPSLGASTDSALSGAPPAASADATEVPVAAEAPQAPAAPPDTAEAAPPAPAAEELPRKTLPLPLPL
eukprot:m51a1_g1445 hypothetical protein (1912) ;mRNA; r:130017-137422